MRRYEEVRAKSGEINLNWLGQGRQEELKRGINEGRWGGGIRVSSGALKNSSRSREHVESLYNGAARGSRSAERVAKNSSEARVIRR